MLKAMIEKIEQMTGAHTYEIGGEHFSDQHLYRIDPKKDKPNILNVSSLDALVKLVKAEANDLFPGDNILIHVKDFRTVDVFTTLDGEMDRCWLYRSTADVPNVCIGSYMSQERAVIQLQSLYAPTEDVTYLLQLISRITKEHNVSSTDNGVTQNVQVNQGVALVTNLPVKPMVTLKPFRTFLEVPQPDSLFLLRLNEDAEVGLVEADGGAWKLEAARNIEDYFYWQLQPLVDSGRVVVMR